MKTKRIVAFLLVMILTVAMAGSLVGCGSADKEADKKVESGQNEKDTGKSSDDVTATPEPTATPKPTATPEPTPTPTPEVLPTAEELIAANEDMIGDNRKMTMEFSYKASDATGAMTMSIKSEEVTYGNTIHEVGEISVSMLGITETTVQDTYYVDDEETGLRTEYYYDEEEGKWVKSQYAYIDLEEDDEDGENEENPFKSMTNATVTKDGEYYCLSGELQESDTDELSDIMGIDGMTVEFVNCELKFDVKTKELLFADVTIRFMAGEVDGVSVSAEDFIIKMEKVTEPIVIPEEALAAESDVEVDIDVDWEFDWDDTEDDEEEEDADDTAAEVPEPDKYAKSEMPKGWDSWYDEYNCKSGSFMMWSDALVTEIPIIIYEKENWYFDNQYEYSLYLAVDDPAICDHAPAYQVDYGDSYVATANNLERAMAELVTRDYTETKGMSDVVPIVCNGKQCFYLDVSSYENVFSYIVFQDIGMESYVEIAITTYDNSDPLTVIQKFLLDMSRNEGVAI